MDKLKAQWVALAPYTFWVMCGGILIVSVASWWMSTSTLKTEQAAHLSEIETVFKQVGSVRQTNPQHPNASTIKGMETLNRSFALQVAEGWKKQYEQQVEVLVWPASFPDDFREKVDKMRPIESVPGPVTPIEFALPIDMLQQYRNYIEFDIPKLAKTIGAEWTAKSAAISSEGGSYGASSSAVAGVGSLGGGQAVTEDKSIVAWSPSNQQELLQTHFGFTASAELPSTLEVLYAQEDLWVLQNIMDIIAKANTKATARHEAAIKEIHFIRLGRSALGLAGTITPLGAGGSQDGSSTNPMGGMATPGGATGMPMPGAGGAGGAGGATAAMPMPGAGGAGAGAAGGGASYTDPADGRYVDEKYMPLPATRLRNALKSATKEDALLAVAKRVPVRLRFKVDQRRMNRVLAECGNSRLPVEIRQVRINRQPASSSGEGGSYGGSDFASTDSSSLGGDSSSSLPSFTGGAESYGGGSMFGGSGGSGARGMVKGSAVSDATVDPHLIDVELYGIVYIYNPVNRSQLGLDDATTIATQPPTATPPATTPVSSSPATSSGPSATTGPSATAVPSGTGGPTTSVVPATAGEAIAGR